MLIAVVGGKLQGVEAIYLAGKAGYRTLLIDKSADVPAKGLCDCFLQFNFSLKNPVPRECPEIDLILPAVEDEDVLFAIKLWAEEKDIPLAFDLGAYRISKSKLISNAVFEKMNLPVPLSWPGCNYPLVVKPDQASGSHGVEVFDDSKSFMTWFSTSQRKDHVVIQEFIKGPTYSIEVVGVPGKYEALQVTDLSMDKVYDCKRVTAPTELGTSQINQFKAMSLDIAEEIGLKGIMDVEVVSNNNKLILLEIDARLPSQTPIAVYCSTGINMVEMLGNLFLDKKDIKYKEKHMRFAVVEHLLVTSDGLEICGEHIMVQEDPLTLWQDFYGADEAITNYASGKKQWVATLIFTDDTYDNVTAKMQNCYKQIRTLC